MSTIELSSTMLSACHLTMCDGQAVLRIQNRIFGLIGVRRARIPAAFHDLLAKATFTGSMANAQIVWSTDVFQSEPVRLSELQGKEKQRYAALVKQALQAYADAFQQAENGVKKLLFASISYSDEDAVFCADNRVVITEWGLSRKGGGDPVCMSWSFIDGKEEPTITSVPSYGDVGDKPGGGGEQEPSNPDDASSEWRDDNPFAPIHPEPEVEERKPGDAPLEGENDNPFDSASSDSNADDVHLQEDSSDGGSKPKGRWRWLVALFLLLLALMLVGLLCKRCGGKVIQPVTPEIDSTEVVLSDDSLRYIVNSRLLILVSADDKVLEDFARSFRKKYSDEKRYILSNPDTVMKRVTLSLPAEERKRMEEELPDEFPEYELIILPETMYKVSYVPNDPYLQDADKRWYFDECAVWEAWDETRGSDKVVVAVIDDGFDLSHPELSGKVVKPYNAVTHSTRITPSPSGHGTHVAATAVGYADNGEGTAGIAPDCLFMPIQVGDAQGKMTLSAILDAFSYAIQQKADVVNVSLGMSFGPFVQFAPLYVQRNFRSNMYLQEERLWNHVFSTAGKQNVTFVLAGGNENCLIGLDPMQRHPGAIKVSAVQRDTQKASFSNYGDMSTVSAPGVRIFNAIPGNRYTYMDGTSMAAPIVTGGCALLKSQDASRTTNEMIQILRQTGKKSPSDVGPIVNFAKALNAQPSVSDECDAINQRYHELLKELEAIKREHPECVHQPDTMTIPRGLELTDLVGRWKSTSSLYNESQEEVVIYFTFNGTSNARLDIVEPDGTTFSASLSVSVSNDRIFIDQRESARNAQTNKTYFPYRFELKPDANRKAEGSAQNKVQAANAFQFNLIKI